ARPRGQAPGYWRPASSCPRSSPRASEIRFDGSGRPYRSSQSLGPAHARTGHPAWFGATLARTGARREHARECGNIVVATTVGATMTSTPTDRSLSPSTSMDAVTLRVGDLEQMTSYYTGAFALAPLEERTRGTEVHRVLGRGTTPMLRLVHTPGLPPVDPRQAGLFHTAFLFDDAPSLAATVYRAAQDRRGSFVGSSDHLVSEAFYFTDHEGNGVELYTDRPRET